MFVRISFESARIMIYYDNESVDPSWSNNLKIMSLCDVLFILNYVIMYLANSHVSSSHANANLCIVFFSFLCSFPFQAPILLTGFSTLFNSFSFLLLLCVPLVWCSSCSKSRPLQRYFWLWWREVCTRCPRYH